MEYSIVIPVYNSSSILNELFDRVNQTMTILGKPFEVIFVNDNSKDNSWSVLKNIKSQNEFVKIINLSKNYGQQSCTFCGLRFCTGNYIITIDDDLQNQPEDIPLLINELTKSKAEIVYGIGAKSKSQGRKIGSNVWKIGAKYVDKGLGEGSSFRLFTKEINSKLLLHNQAIIYIDELLFWYTNNIAFTTVQHKPRVKGKSGYSSLKIMRLVLKLSFNYSTVPLKLMVLLGFSMSLFSFTLGAFFIFRKVFFNVTVPGFTATIVTILFSTSVILLSMGIIGKYLSNIFIILNKKPAYSINEIEL